MVTIAHDHEARRRSYELLAAEFGLGESGSVGDSRESARGESQ